MKNIEYILGLDLGISSVGWAVVARKDNNEWFLDDFGVRLFPVAESTDSKTRGKTLTNLKREKRSIRRSKRRRCNRKKDLIKLLIRNDFIDDQSLNQYLEFHPATNLIKYNREKFYNPYYLRYIGLTQKLSKEELVWSLIHVANRRGYLNKFLLENESEKKNQISSSINKADNILKNYGSISEAIIKDYAFRDERNEKAIFCRNRKSDDENFRFLFSRSAYQSEVLKLLENQFIYYPQLNNDLRNEIMKIIFRQRDFEDGPGPKDKIKKDLWINKNKMYSKSFVDLMGKCSKYLNEKVGHRASILFDIYQICAELSKITVYLDNKKELCQFIINNFLYEWDGNKAGIYLKKILQTSGVENKCFSSPGYKNIKLDLNFLSKIKTIFNLDFIKDTNVDINNLNFGLIFEIGNIIYKNKTPIRRRKELEKLFINKQISVSDEQFNNLLHITSSTTSLSFKYMQEAIKAFFYDGISIGRFNADFDLKIKNFQDSVNEEKIKKFLKNGKQFEPFRPIIDSDLWKNPIVFRAINESRKVLKALFKKYPIIHKINIETTKELGKSYKDREAIKRNQDQNAISNINAKNELESYGINPDTGKNLERYKLWKSQNQICIYSGKEIPIKEIDSPLLEIDHIIPYSKLANDSFQNKVLVYRDENQNKGNRAPMEWLKSNSSKLIMFNKIVNNLFYKRLISKNKKELLLIENSDNEALQGFVSRNLNDTRYIARYILNWLKYEFSLWEYFGLVKPQVQSINGAVTSRFRRLWLKKNAWGLDTKVRDITPWHHAVDAIIAANFYNFSHIMFATDIANLINYKKRNSYLEYEKFYNELIQKWKNKNLNYKLYNIIDASRKLESLKYYNNKTATEKRWNELQPSLIKDLDKIIEKRMPLILTTQFKSEEKIINRKNDEKIILKILYPKFNKIKEQKNYYFENKNELGNIHYPFPSWFIIKKVKGNIFDSELIVSKKNSIKNGQLNKEKYYLDSKNQIWQDTSYHAVGIRKNSNIKNGYEVKWFKKIEIIKNKQLMQNWSLLFKNTTVCYKNNENKYVYKDFQSKMGKQIFTSLSNTKFHSNPEISKKVFDFQNTYTTLSNWFNDLKILNIDILGKTKLVKIKEFQKDDILEL